MHPHPADRTLGINDDDVSIEGLAEGTYDVALEARLLADTSVVDTVTITLTVSRAPVALREPGETLVSGVDIATVNLELAYGDLMIPNRGVSLAFARNYNSANRNVYGVLGYGWRHSYQVLLLKDVDADVYRIQDGDGQIYTFPSLARDVPGVMASAAPYHTQLVKNPDGSFDYLTKSKMRFHFREALRTDRAEYLVSGYLGNRDSISDTHGNQERLVYDSLGRLSKVIDPAGRELAFTYEAAGRLVRANTRPGAERGITSCTEPGQFDRMRSCFTTTDASLWRIVEIDGPGGLRIRYTYDTRGNLASATRDEGGPNPLGSRAASAAWTYDYGPANAPAAVDAVHLIASVTDPNANATTYDYEFAETGLPVKTILFPEGVSNAFSYTRSGTAITGVSVVDGNGIATDYAFVGRFAHSIVRAGATTQLDYDGFGVPTAHEDAEHLMTTVAPDAKGNPGTVTATGTDGKSVTTTLTFDQTYNVPTKAVDPNGNVTTVTLDQTTGDVRLVQLPEDNKVTFGYYPNGDVQSSTDTRGLSTTYSYDQYGNLTGVSRHTGQETISWSATYDVRSRMRTSGGTTSPAVTIEYDALDRVVRTTAADAQGVRDALTTDATYYADGQLHTETASGGAQSYTATYTLDHLNRTTRVDETPSGSPATFVEYEYDNNSNLKSYVDRRGVKTTYDVNDLNIVTRVTVLGGATEPNTVVELQPDKVGNILWVKDSHSKTTIFDHDGLYRPSMTHYPDGRTDEVHYDDNGNVMSATDRNGYLWTFGYDGLDRPTSFGDPLGRVRTLDFDDQAGRVTATDVASGLEVVYESDGVGRTIRRALSFGNEQPRQTTVQYSGLVMTTTDARGKQTVETYSSFGDLGTSATTLQAGSKTATTVQRVVSMHYSALGAMTSYTDPRGKTSTYAVDGFNRVRSAAMPENVTSHYDYDGGGNVTASQDGRGISSTMVYDRLSRLTKRFVDGVEVFRADYDDAAHTKTVSDARNNATKYHYDPVGHATKVDFSDLTSISYVFDGDFLREIHDGRNQVTRYDYDPLGRVTRTTDHLGRVTIGSYQDFLGGQIRRTTDRRGVAREERFNAYGELLSVRIGDEPAPAVQYEYDPNGNRTAMLDGLGNRTTYEYDELNRVRQVVHAENRVERYDYDLAGNVTAYNPGAGSDVTMVYDGLNRLASRTDAAGHETRFAYDAASNLLEQREWRDPYGRTTPSGAAASAIEAVTTFTYDAQAALTSTRLQTQWYKGLGNTNIPDGTTEDGTWTFGRDANRNLTSVLDPLGHETTYRYDSRNRVDRIERPLGRVTTFAYDENGQVRERTDARGQSVQLTYNHLLKPDTVRYFAAGGALERNQTMAYDPEGNLTNVHETVAGVGSRDVERRYDPRGRMTYESGAAGGSVTYGYDAANNVTSLTTQAGGTSRALGFGYDQQNRLSTVTDAGGQVASYSWRPDDQLSSVTYGNGATRSYGYDGASRLASITNAWQGGSEGYAFTYDEASNRKTEQRSVDGATVRSIAYAYDTWERLTGASYDDGTGARAMAYGYDLVGNRVSETGTKPTGQQVSRTLAYDDLNQVTSITDGIDANRSATYEHDANGNLTRELRADGTDRRYGYDTRDQMVRAWNVVGGADEELGSYDYDFQKRRVRKSAQNVSLEYLYSGNNVLAETSGGARVASYDYGTDLVRAQFGGEGARWYGHDGLGSPTALTAGDGTLAARYEYDAWGEEITAPQPTINKIGFTGYRKDDETGLDYTINRYYSPDLGRFTSTDPLTELDRPDRLQQPQGLNLYPYVMNNPQRYTDPDGLDWAFNRETGAVQFLGTGAGDPKKRRKYEGKANWQILPDGYLLDGTDAWGKFWGKYRGHWIKLQPSGHAERLQETDESLRRRWLKAFERDCAEHARRSRDLQIGAQAVGKELKAAIYVLGGLLFGEIIAAASPMFAGSLTTIFTETPIPGAIEKGLGWLASKIPAIFGSDLTTLFQDGVPTVRPLVPEVETPTEGVAPESGAAEAGAQQSGASGSEAAVSNAGSSVSAERGTVADANFAQSRINKAETYSEDGRRIYSELAGRPINTVDDLVGAIKSGVVQPSQLPVDYVVTGGGTKLILNTRTSVALYRAGIPKAEWYGINRTGTLVEGGEGLTFDDLAAMQLKRNKLPPTGSPDYPKGKE